VGARESVRNEVAHVGRDAQWASTKHEPLLAIVRYKASTCGRGWRCAVSTQHEGPVEGSSIIYEVASASTARVIGVDPLGKSCSWYAR